MPRLSLTVLAAAIASLPLPISVLLPLPSLLFIKTCAVLLFRVAHGFVLGPAVVGMLVFFVKIYILPTPVGGMPLMLLPILFWVPCIVLLLVTRIPFLSSRKIFPSIAFVVLLKQSPFLIIPGTLFLISKQRLRLLPSAPEVVEFFAVP